MKYFSIITLGLSLLLITSCNQEPDPVPIPTPVTNVSAELDFVYTDFSGTTSSYITQGNQFSLTVSDPVTSIKITLENAQVGTFTLDQGQIANNTVSIVCHGQSDTSYFSQFYTGSQAGSITISSIDNDLKRISGSFDAIVVNPFNFDQITVSNGNFDVSYIQL